MYRILIVDDEPYIVNGLKAIIERENDEEVEIKTAWDGEEALKLICSLQEKPDLLITDIRMPKKTGIELLQEIRQQGIPVRTIVLSGYNDFEYVRSMAVLGIENYLLKPVNEEELNSTLQDVFRKINKEREQRYKAAMDENLIRENIINRWLYDSIGENELLERAEFLEMDLEAVWYQPCILKIFGKSKENKEYRKQKEEIYRLCCEEFRKLPKCYYAKNYGGDTIAVFCGEEKVDAEVKDTLNCCMERIKKELGLKIYVLLGTMVEDYWNVAGSFREAIAGGLYLDKIQDGEEHKQIGETTVPLSRHMAEYILEHYQEDLSLKTLSVHFKGNSAYMGQIFKKDMGKAFSEYLKDVRIAKAKELLKNDRHNVQEISALVGFQNVTYFSAVFKKETGLTPAEYRKEFSTEII